MPPLTDSYNDICSVSFAGFHWLNTMRDQQHVFMIAVCLLPCLVKDSECVHVNIMCCLSHTHTQAMMGKQQSCRRECSCSMSGEATIWHDPLNNRCRRAHTLWQLHTQWNTLTPILTNKKKRKRSHTSTHAPNTQLYCMWPCPERWHPPTLQSVWQWKARKKKMRCPFFFKWYFLLDFFLALVFYSVPKQICHLWARFYTQRLKSWCISWKDF